jgi:poly-beta-1,6-N-acetyl-D-glucosamine synthase
VWLTPQNEKQSILTRRSNFRFARSHVPHATFESTFMNHTIWVQYFIHPWHHALKSLVDWPGGILDCLKAFILFFPLLLSLSWSVSALVKLLSTACRTWTARPEALDLPTFAVLIPFYGDGREAMRSLESLQDVTPQPQQIFLIDDGSPFGGGLPADFPLPVGVTLLRLPRNVGKAGALSMALREVESEVVVCMDADTTAMTKDWTPMLAQFARSKELGAITGKIRPRRLGNLTQWMQAIDYLAVICMVKCSESLWGGLTTVSGAWVAYRRQALVETGGWDPEASAEDIDLSWHLQSSGWRLHYDFNWTANVEMASRWGSLWKQRKRWSSGMAQTLRKRVGGVFRPGARHGVISFLTVLGCLWVVSSLGMILVTLGELWNGHVGLGLLKSHAGLITLGGEAFLLQLLVGFLVDRGSWRRYPLMILLAFVYPLYFWGVLFTSNIAGLYQGFFLKESGRWMPTSVLETSTRAAASETQTPSLAGQEAGHSWLMAETRRETPAEVYHLIPVSKWVGAFTVQMMRMLVLGWGLLCFYAALCIMLRGHHSVMLYGIELLQLFIGAVCWFAACLRLPASIRFKLGK